MAAAMADLPPDSDHHTIQGADAAERWKRLQNASPTAAARHLPRIDHKVFYFVDGDGNEFLENPQGRFKMDRMTRKWLPDA